MGDAASAGGRYSTERLSCPEGIRWRPEEPWARCLHLHGLGAHSGWFAPLGRLLAASGIEVVAPDLVPAGSTELPSPRELRVTARAALQQFSSVDSPLFLAGTSLGGCLSIDLLDDRGPRTRRRDVSLAGVILFAPAFQPTYISAAETAAIVFRLFLGGSGSFETPAGRWLPVVSDSALLGSLREDPRANLSFSARSHLHAQLLILQAWGRILRPRGGRGLPILCLQGSEDCVVSAKINARIFGRKGNAGGRQYLEVRGGHHDLPWEPHTDGMAERLIAWVREQAAGVRFGAGRQ
jgi:alpha-beta hydrolase superfamily lysophospholipase